MAEEIFFPLAGNSPAQSHVPMKKLSDRMGADDGSAALAEILASSSEQSAMAEAIFIALQSVGKTRR